MPRFTKRDYDTMPLTMYERLRHGWECPVCGGAMYERVRKRDGNLFFGCSDFPNCTGTRPEGYPPYLVDPLSVDYQSAELRTAVALDLTRPEIREAAATLQQHFNEVLVKHHGDQLEDLPQSGFLPGLFEND